MIGLFVGGVLPIFAVGAIGFVLGRLGIFDAAMAAAINRLAFYVGIPALSFRLLVHAPLETFDPRLMAGFLVSEFVMYGAGFIIGRYAFHADAREAVLLGLACALTNHILFVLPIAVTLFGEAAAMPIVAIITVDAIFLFGATLVIMDFMSSPEGSIKQVLGKIARNPPVLSVVGGFAFSLANLEVPKSLDVFLEFAGGTAAPCALFAMGIILSQRQETGRALLPVALTGVKLVLHPFLAWLLLITFFDLPPAITTPAMMVAAAPCGAMSFVFALNYQVRVDAISRAILYSSVGSLLTITLAASL